MTLATEDYYIVVPAEATNEVLNPSAETATTGYTASGAGVSIARVSTYQRRGVYSIEVTTATNVESGLYYGTVNEVDTVSRTFSVDVKGYAGQAMRVQIRTTAGAVLSETTFTANGYWQRPSITRTGNASTTRRLYVVRDAVASTQKFYVDGFYYFIINGTYLDGDMKGFVKSQNDYVWLGAPHASQSWRSGQTRSGGTLVRIGDYARVLFSLGLGMLTAMPIASPTSLGYSSYQTTHVGDREFILQLAFSGTADQIRTKRAALMDALRFDKTTIKQPLIVRYVGKDSTGGDATETLDIEAHYIDGLQDDPQDLPTQTPVRFMSYLPFMERSGETATPLGYQTSVPDTANIMMRDTAGNWEALGSGLNGAALAMVVSPFDGCLYVGGAFTQAGGVADTAYIAKWDGSVWTPLGSGLSAGVTSLAFGPDGTLYAGGLFTNAGGVAAADYIAKWNGSAWSALGSGAGGNVYAMKFDKLGNLYVGGNFLNAGGVAEADYIGVWTAAGAWAALATGLNGIVETIEVGPNNEVYAGGQFTQAAALSTPYIAKWSGSAWSALGAGFNGTVYALKYINGILYIGGFFTFDSTETIAYPRIAQWNSKAIGVVPGITSLDAVVEGMAVDPLTNELHVIGAVATVNGITIPAPDVIYKNGVITFLGIDTQDASPHFYDIAFDKVGNMFIGGDWSASSTSLSATVTVPNVGGNRAYPVITFTGPGWVPTVKNYTTKQAIYFRNLTLLAGETATLDFRPGKKTLTSSFRGNLENYVVPGSTKEIFLQSGSNNVSAYMLGTTAASAAVMVWREGYLSNDGAKR